MGFFLYKGLKKPLVFFGLKNRYIYYAGGIIIAGFLLVAIMSSIIGLFGILLGGVLVGVGVWWTFYLQDKKGLYRKTKNKDEVHIFPKQFKNTILLKFQNEKK